MPLINNLHRIQFWLCPTVHSSWIYTSIIIIITTWNEHSKRLTSYDYQPSIFSQSQVMVFRQTEILHISTNTVAYEKVFKGEDLQLCNCSKQIYFRLLYLITLRISKRIRMHYLIESNWIIYQSFCLGTFFSVTCNSSYYTAEIRIEFANFSYAYKTFSTSLL